MARNQRLLFAIAAVIAAVAGILILLNGSLQPVQAAPGTRCVAPGGSGCDPVACGGTCYASVQAAVDAAADNDEIRVATGTYTGVQTRGGMTQVIYINKTVTIRGGYNSALTTWNPDTYPTTLDAQAQGRVISIIGASAAPTLEALIITGGDAHGLTVNCPGIALPSSGCGGGVFVYQASLTMTRNVVTNNVAAGPSAVATGHGGGLCLVYAHGSVITGNLVVDNTASLGRQGMGGGIHIHSLHDGLVASNQVLSNTATTHNTYVGWGGGIAVSGEDTEGTVQANRIEGNRTNGGGLGSGAGLYQWFGSTHFADNRIAGNHGQEAVYLGYSQSRFESNQVVDNPTTVGVQLTNGDAAASFTAANNVIARSGGDRSLVLWTHSGAPLTATLIHNTLLGSGAGYGVYVDSGYVTLFLTNTIVANHGWGIVNAAPLSSTVTADHTLFWANDQNGIVGTNPVNGDPAFIDIGMGGYHLGPGSAAIDAGVATAESADIDGDSRPLGSAPDIGADEAWWGWSTFLPLVLKGH